MTSPDDPIDRTFDRLLGGLDQRVAPTDVERERARRRLRADLDSVLGAAAESRPGSDRSLQGLAELPRLAENPPSGSRRWARRLLVAAAATVVVVGGFGVFQSLRGGPTQTENLPAEQPPSTTTTTTTTTTTATTSTLPATLLDASDIGQPLVPGPYRVVLGGRPLRFEVTGDPVLIALDASALTLEPSDSRRPDVEFVSVVVAADLFDGQEPSTWVRGLNGTGTEFVRAVEGAGRSEWSIAVDPVGCDLFTVCVPLGPSVPTVGIIGGGQNRVVELVDPEAIPAAVVVTLDGPPGTGGAFALYNAVLASLDFEDN